MKIIPPVFHARVQSIGASASGANLIFLVAAVILALHSVPYQLAACTPPPDHGDDSPEALAAGTASTPYQYRVLVPWLVRGALGVHAISPAAERSLFVAIEVIALVWLAFVFRRYVSLFIADRKVASVAALSVFAILPFNYFNLPYYPYDVPSVLFFTLGLVLIHDERWTWFYPLFVIATLNRETSIFLTVAMVLALADRYPWSKLAILAGSQVALWAAIKAVLYALYAHNRWMGYGIYQFQLKVNLATLYAFPVKGVIALATWGCLWLAVVVWRDRIRDRFLQRNLLTVPFFIAGMLLVGFVTELRIYGEVLPIVLAAAWVAFLGVVRESFVTTAASRAAAVEFPGTDHSGFETGS